MLVQKMKLVSEFSRILTVIAEHGGTWNVERDEGHFRDVHMDVSVLAECPQLTENAGCFNLRHILHFSHYKRTYLASVFLVIWYGNHSVVKLMKLAPKLKLLTTSKIHFHFLLREKKPKHLTLRRDLGIHLDAGNLTTGLERRLTGGRFSVFWCFL